MPTVDSTQELAQLEADFATYWAANDNTTVEYEDQEFTRPGDGAAYVKFMVGRAALSAFPTDHAESGSRRSAHPGVVRVEVHTPIGSGAAVGRAMAESAAANYPGRVLNAIHFSVPTVRGAGQKDRRYYLHIMSAPFTRHSFY